MRGRFVPFQPSSEIRDRVRGYGNKLPMSEINSIRREFSKRKLGEPVEPKTQSQNELVDPSLFSDTAPTIDPNLFSDTAPTQPVAAAVAPPSAAQAGGVIPLASPAPSSALAQQQSSLQLVGGGNPINQAKNAQIPRTI